MTNVSDNGFSLVIKSGTWYVISNFFVKGFVFITIPIFSRLMTPGEFGAYSNFIAWVNLFAIIVTMNLHTSINRARLDYHKQIDAYCSSILITSTLITLLFYAITCCFINDVAKMTSLDIMYIHIIYWYLLFQPAVEIFQIYQRVTYKYKISVCISALTTFSTLLLSITLILFMHNKFLARVIGYIVPMIIISISIYIATIFKGKSFDLAYCKYALLYSWPFVPHLLATYMLSTSGRIMITAFCGSEYTAIYTIASTCMSILVVFLTSLNNAVSPWIFDQMYINKYNMIYKITLPYILIFYIPLQIIVLLSPEIVILLGGNQYKAATDTLPILTLSVFFQFAYCLYVNIEQYARKTWAIAVGTLIAASINISLNYFLLPQYGYQISAYITLLSYIILFVIHFCFVKLIGYPQIYNDKCVLFTLLIAICIQFIMVNLYIYTTLRYIIVILECIASLLIILRYRENITAFIKRPKL